MRIKAFYIVCLILSNLLSISCGEKKVAPVAEKKLPNIIYILADDLGYGDISSFNPGGKINTPNIDKLAQEGMKFTDAHSPSAVCSPTRYGIITGRYSWRSELKNGVLTGKSKALIPKSRTTVASLLKGAGYQTAFIGKWHLGWDWAQKDSTNFGAEGWNPEDFDNLDFTKPITNTPNDLGFDYAYGHSGSLDMAPYVYVENGKSTAEVDHITEDTGDYTWWRKGPTAADFVHDDVTPNFFRKSMNYIKEKSKGETPFFLYLALPSPHTPILPTEEWLGKSGLNPYADFMLMIDDYVGQLTKTLEEQGLDENTLLIFTSDNGCSPEANFELLEEKGHDPSGIFRGHKADIYEGGHRVPFLMKWPGKIRPNSVSNETICHTDLMATCADIVGVDLKETEGEDSFSLLPILDKGDSTGYKREATVHHSINGSFSIRKENYKLILCPGSGGWSYPRPGTDDLSVFPKFQLYDLKVDPSEENNLFEKYPDKTNELAVLMKVYIENGRSTPGTKQTNASLHLNGKEWHQIEPILSH
ncbi:arylsulfatase [Maribacter algarum]|uniref:Arylsulfatase n=1 Tax=Maribacter algarum (ex Zhang et al. 2020) TaxID=2578118 RepID=A0A5S3PSP9_9FLAO|nr:arylsulfatase [Maribacter algarum]TMM58035.1 arylsulfatase [Maribacter algarum]